LCVRQQQSDFSLNYLLTDFLRRLNLPREAERSSEESANPQNILMSIQKSLDVINFPSLQAGVGPTPAPIRPRRTRRWKGFVAMALTTIKTKKISLKEKTISNNFS